MTDQLGDTIDVDFIGELVAEAAADDGSDRSTPVLYQLVSTAHRSDTSPTLINAIVQSCVEYVGLRLPNNDRQNAVVFLSFIDRSELLLGSRRLQAAVVQYVTEGLPYLSPDVRDAAILLLRRVGVGRTVAHEWFERIRSEFQSRPDWPKADVLAELMPYVPAYDPAKLITDLGRLRAMPDFETNVRLREHRWARRGLLLKEILDMPHKSRVNGGLDVWHAHLLAEQNHPSLRGGGDDNAE